MRGDQPAVLLGQYRVDALLVSSPANVRYLSGFTTPADGRVLLQAHGSRLITDGRYQAQAEEESTLELEIRRDWLPWVAERVGAGSLGIEAESLSVAHYQELQEAVGGRVVPLREVLRAQRSVKIDEELDRLRQAARITDETFEHILGFIEPGVSELEVALELERTMLGRGADGKSFDIVVASGPRSAMPHGVASRKSIAKGEMVTLDFGATVGGYHADMTRTVAVGDVGEKMRDVYDAVLEAQLAGLAAAGSGVKGGEADAAARKVLERRGLAEYFAHSLGHGVGLQIHEAPRLSSGSQDVLEPGMAVTIEPGVYLTGTGGVRIEDLIVITESGRERLSRSPKELIVL